MNEIYKGYIPDIIEPDQFVLGASTLARIILRPDGQWVDYLPEDESQVRATETFNCTAHATLNCYEILFEEVLGFVRNNSDRALGIMAGTRPPGNTAHKVAQAARHGGLIKEESLPFSDDIDTPEKYYSPDPLPQPILDEGKKFLTEYEVGHEWALTGGESDWKERMMEALQFSPLAAAVYAWQQEGGGVARAEDLFIRPERTQDTHLTCIVGYKKNENWVCYDSYAPYIKKLDWNFGFNQVKRFSLIVKDPKIVDQTKIGFMQKLILLINQLIQKLYG